MDNMFKNNNIKTFIKNIKKKYGTMYYTEKLYKDVKITISSVFFALPTDSEDFEILHTIVLFIIFIISKYNRIDTSENDSTIKWYENQCYDIKNLINIILPYYNNKTTIELENLRDLNMIVFNNNDSSVNDKYFDVDVNNLGSELKYSNIIISLLERDKKLLKDYNNKIIYDMIYVNVLCLLKTLEIMNGKYYVNWVNIIPINIENYKNTELYKDTYNFLYEKFNQLTFRKNIIDDDNIILCDYYGLWIGDIYNIIRNNLYSNSKPVKWLFYIIQINNKSKSKQKIYLIENLNNFINLETILNNKWSDDVKASFEEELKNILLDNKINKNKGMFETLKYLLLFVVNHRYSEIKSSKFMLTTDSNNVFNNDKDIVKNITSKDIIILIKHILSDKDKCENMWKTIKYYLMYLSKTYYGKQLINRDCYEYKINKNCIIDNNTLHLKNIYNISKSLSHTSYQEWKETPGNWLGLSSTQKNNFFDHLYIEDNNIEWINIKHNYERDSINNLGIKPYQDYVKNMLDLYKETYLNIIFETMIYDGILSKFEKNNELTKVKTEEVNKKICEVMTKKFTDNNDDWSNSYYYINNEKYKYIETNTEKYKKYNTLSPGIPPYFNKLTGQKWMMLYSLNWISQINFFKHYIYNRLILVTGSTGQGKTTQVTKLILYAIKVVDYNNTGKLVCTSPKIDPLKKNIERISEEAGFKVDTRSDNNSELSDEAGFKVDTSSDNNSEFSDERYFQFKFKAGDYIDKYNDYNMKIVTDGTLLNELMNNPLLLHNNNGEFINKLIYDIIFVDEAHEHNTNMDMILTLMKKCCYVNNKIRLFIVSATMDKDEPRYRRFYKEINDSLMFPIKDSINDPYSLHKLPMKCVQYLDRRYDISPPIINYPYKLEEKYYDDSELEISNSTNYRKLFDNANKKALEVVINLCKSELKGNMLVFSIGENEIIETVEHLNKNITNEKYVAIPFYGKMNERYKNIIIGNEIPKIKIEKNKIHTELRGKKDPDENDNVSYTNIIIVSTNIVESSITLNELYYVIDIGYSKVSESTSLLKMNTKLSIKPIPESNRLQRRGRVGRTNDGSVHYIYKKYSRCNIIDDYKICNDKIYDILLSILCEKKKNYNNIIDTDNQKLLSVYDEIDPNIININLVDNLNEDDYVSKSKLIDIYKINFDKNNNYDNSYYSDLKKTSDSVKFFESGNLLKNIIDLDGKFFIIHYNEKYIKRNILNEIIYNCDIMSNNIAKSNIFDINLFRDFFIYSNSFPLLIDITGSDIINNYVFSMNYIHKTTLYKVVNDIKKDLSLSSINQAITLMAGVSLNCGNEIYNMIILFKKYELEFLSLDKIFIPTNKKIILSKYKNIKSDLVIIYRVLIDIKKTFSHLKVFNITNFFEHSNDYKELKKDIDTYKIEISKWANKNYLRDDFIIKYLNSIAKEYCDVVKENKIKKVINNNLLDNIKSIDKCKEFANEFKKNLYNYNNIDENIIRSFVYGYSLQFIIKNNNKYIINNSIKLCNFSDKYTFVNNNMEILLYMYEDVVNEDTSNFRILSYVNIDWLLNTTSSNIITNRFNDIVYNMYPCEKIYNSYSINIKYHIDNNNKQNASFYNIANIII